MTERLIEAFSTQGVYVLRIMLAAICGGFVGFERSKRQKDAGIRTHIIVALGSALVMIVSKYAFGDLALSENLRVDASRIASNVVTGVSFLGAGVIFVKEQSIRGLTTAAGIWATAGLGLAIGGGLYIVGIACTVLLFVIQTLLHKYGSKLEGNTSKVLYVEVDGNGNHPFEIGAVINRYNSTLHTLEILYADGKNTNRASDSMILRAVVYPKNEASFNLIVSSIRALKGVRDLYVD